MTFNLNKNNGNQSKFDLSKKENTTQSKPIVNPPKEEKNNNKLIWLIPIILIVGAGIWYSVSKSENNSKDINETVTQTNSNHQINDEKATSSIGKNISQNTENEITKTNSLSEYDSNNISAINNVIPAKFPKGSSSFSHLDQSLVEKISSYLNTNSNAKIIINGYASSEGDLDTNQQISQKRADNFKDLLISKGINSSNVNAIGKGITNPVASNETEQGRQKNRRVEVIIP